MGSGSKQAQGAATTGQNLADTYSGDAGSIFSTLSPILSTQAAHPSGMSPTDIANADTASTQAAGGSQGAAVGSGLLRAARTRNAGGSDAAIADSARTAGKQLSGDVLQTRMKNAQLKAGQQSQAISGLGNLEDASITGGNQALGIVPSAVNADTNAYNSSWDWATDILDPILQSGSKVGAAALGG